MGNSMNGWIFIIAILAVILLVILMVRKIRYGSACCGEMTMAEKKVGVRDNNKKHYPFTYTARVDGMICHDLQHALCCCTCGNLSGDPLCKVDGAHRIILHGGISCLGIPGISCWNADLVVTVDRKQKKWYEYWLERMDDNGRIACIPKRDVPKGRPARGVFPRTAFRTWEKCGK